MVAIANKPEAFKLFLIWSAYYIESEKKAFEKHEVQNSTSVVRCKDCYHYYKYSDWDRSRSESLEVWECRLLNKDFGFDGYCSKGEAKCKYFMPEEDNLYPLCVNKGCKESKTCNISTYMVEEPYWSN